MNTADNCMSMFISMLYKQCINFNFNPEIPDNTGITGVFATVIACVYVGCMTRHVHIHISCFKKLDTQT